jgi:hypothetical protein
VLSEDHLFEKDGQVDEQKQDMPSSISTDSACVGYAIPDLQRKNETRLRWIELPLFDPQQVLVKSADYDGANETSELSSQGRSMDIFQDPIYLLSKKIAKKETKKINPSLQSAIDKDNAKREVSESQDEKTVVTTITTTSDATLQTTNKDSAVKKPARTKTKVDDLVLAKVQ